MVRDWRWRLERCKFTVVCFSAVFAYCAILGGTVVSLRAWLPVLLAAALIYCTTLLCMLLFSPPVSVIADRKSYYPHQVNYAMHSSARAITPTKQLICFPRSGCTVSYLGNGMFARMHGYVHERVMHCLHVASKMLMHACMRYLHV